MKKTHMIAFLALILMAGPVFGNDTGKSKNFFIQLNGGLLFPADGNYQDVYGSSVFYPGVRVGVGLPCGVFFSLGYDSLKASGTTPVLEEEASSTQQLVSLGAGYQGDFSEKLGYRVQAALVYFSYNEEALGEEISDTALGFDLEGALVVDFSPRVYGLVLLGYTYGSDDIEGVDIKLGGFKTGIGLGLRF